MAEKMSRTESDSSDSVTESSSSRTSSDSTQLGWEEPFCSSELEKKAASEVEMMKERFAKLLLGEDMSGSGKGVCSALTISNAITNLCASVFGQLWRLEPLPSEKGSMWQREMDWLLSVSDHIVELMPSLHTLPDGSRIEVMTCRLRRDLAVNLPALRKLDNMLLETLNGFAGSEFWYVDQGVVAPETGGLVIEAIQRQGDKWWLPVPHLPPGGLSEEATRQLHCKLECVNQILKAAIAINSIALAEMEVPDSYLETLPKNGRDCLGHVIYRYITSEQFSPECLLDCVDLSSEHAALEIVNRVEAAIHLWRRRQHPHPNHSVSKSSWEIVKDLMVHGDKREMLAERAERLLLSLKQRFPGLPQTTLDTCKIQCNKDVGKSILESYSRVLESLAFNIVARIEDVLYVDDVTKQSDKLTSVPAVSLGCQKKVQAPYTVLASGTPFQSAYTTPSFSPGAPLISPATMERTPTVSRNCNRPAQRGLGVKKALTNYLSSDVKLKNIRECPVSASNRTTEQATLYPRMGEKESSSICMEAKSQQRYQ